MSRAGGAVSGSAQCHAAFSSMMPCVEAAAETTPNRLVNLALETLLRQTGAELAGFLSLDEAPELRLVLPAQAPFDCQLSRRLTQQEWQEFLPSRPYQPSCGAP